MTGMDTSTLRTLIKGEEQRNVESKKQACLCTCLCRGNTVVCCRNTLCFFSLMLFVPFIVVEIPQERFVEYVKLSFSRLKLATWWTNPWKKKMWHWMFVATSAHGWKSNDSRSGAAPCWGYKTMWAFICFLHKNHRTRQSLTFSATKSSESWNIAPPLSRKITGNTCLDFQFLPFISIMWMSILRLSLHLLHILPPPGSTRCSETFLLCTYVSQILPFKITKSISPDTILQPPDQTSSVLHGSP